MNVDLSLVDVWDAPPGAPTDDEIEGLADPDRAPAFHEAARWAIASDGAAEWTMARVSALQDQRNTLEHQRDEFVRKVSRWFDKSIAPVDRLHRFFVAHLEAYALRERARTGGERKTVALPSGKVATHGAGPKAKVVDEPAVIAWAKATLAGPDRLAVVKQSESVLVTELRKLVQLVEVPTRVMFSPCGCLSDLPPWDDEPAVAALGWTVGTGMTCPECAEYALVARWDETVRIVRDLDGLPVPGVDVDMGDVTAKVTAL